ncbi:hypothetical protein BU17DRAFT_78889 [Hysterangium stoloniferum]|nr:hypothetical protein BU17DRAFT_78889 [Hysterangium stoloniferum]
MNLNPLPRSFGPSPLLEQSPRRQQKHGRQYSVQLDIEEKPEGQEDNISGEINRGVRETKELPRLPVENTTEFPAEEIRAKRDDSYPGSLSLKVPRIERRDQGRVAEQTTAEDEELSPEELFARQFGYSLPNKQNSPEPLPITSTFDEQVFQVILPDPQICRRSVRHHLGPTVEGEEGNLIGLPPPPLLRPSAFWRNTWRSALYTPSFHLVRRSTFIAAGLTLDQPVCDLSAFEVESRITVGKTRGLGGSAAVPVALAVFG